MEYIFKESKNDKLKIYFIFNMYYLLLLGIISYIICFILPFNIPDIIINTFVYLYLLFILFINFIFDVSLFTVRVCEKYIHIIDSNMVQHVFNYDTFKISYQCIEKTKQYFLIFKKNDESVIKIDCGKLEKDNFNKLIAKLNEII